jgi:hypothetical protein
LSLRAPIAVPVEIRAPAGRLYRLAWNVGEDGLRLEKDSSLEPGRDVQVAFALPGGETLALRGEIGPGESENDEITFIEPTQDARIALRRYVHERLGLPS